MQRESPLDRNLWGDLQRQALPGMPGNGVSMNPLDVSRGKKFGPYAFVLDGTDTEQVLDLFLFWLVRANAGVVSPVLPVLGLVRGVSFPVAIT